MTTTDGGMRARDLPTEIDALSGSVLDAAFTVHSALGPGLLERIYTMCLAHELNDRGFRVSTEVRAPVVYKQRVFDAGYRMDLVVDECIVVEIKAVEALLDVHHAQLWT